MPEDPANSPPSKVQRARRRAESLRQGASDLQHRAHATIEQERGRRTWVRVVADTWDADRARAGGLLAGGLAYRLFLWELPAALLVVSLLGLGSSAFGETATEAARSIGLSGTIARSIAQAVNDAGRSRWWLLIVAAVLALLAGASAARSLWLIAELAWNERKPRRPAGVRASLVFGGFMLAGILLNVILTRVINGDIVVDLLEWIVSVFLIAGIALAAMVLLPHRDVRWFRLAPGALVFALALRLLSIATVVYFAPKLGRVHDLYGSLGMAIVILLWLFLIGRAWVACQFLNATIAGVRASPPRDNDDGVA